MYKKELQKIITESFINNVIDIERFINVTEKLNRITEKDANAILTKLIEGPEVYTNTKYNPMAFVIPKLRRDLVNCYQKCKENSKGFMAKQIYDNTPKTKLCIQKCKANFVKAKMMKKGK